jgi:hypothetical protein
LRPQRPPTRWREESRSSDYGSKKQVVRCVCFARLACGTEIKPPSLWTFVPFFT